MSADGASGGRARESRRIGWLVVGAVVVGAIVVGGLTLGPGTPTGGPSGAETGTPTPALATRTAAPRAATPAAPAGDAATVTPHHRFNRTRVERLLHTYVNRERRTRGLAPLEYNETLRDIARYHNEDMAANGYYAHTAPDGETIQDRYERFGLDCRLPAQNRTLDGAEVTDKTIVRHKVREYGTGRVVTVRTERELAAHVVREWMQSPSHEFLLLLEAAEQMGAGVYVTENDIAFATIEFC